jgi:serine/threonine-protein kinase
MNGDSTGAPGTSGIRAIPPGTLLAFRYRLGIRVDVGNAAEIYGALEEAGGTAVLVKMVRPALAGKDGGVVALRLAEQAEALRLVNHPGIARLVADGWDEPLGARFLVLEVLTGETLEAELWRKGTFALAPALDLILAAVDALEVLHAQRYLHLKLNPRNIFLRPPPAPFSVKLTDLGCYRMESRVAPPRRPTTVLGFMAPERIRGERCDARADVHAAGAVLYRMLAGRPPFAGMTPEEVFETRRQAPPPIAGVSRAAEVDAVVRRCLADDAGERFAGVGELREALRGLRGRIA